MKKRKAQATILIILAITIVMIIGIFFLVKSSNFKQTNLDTSRVYSFTESCIKQTSTEIIYDIGKRGGYYFAPDPRSLAGVPYYDSRNLPPTIEQMEKEISSYIERKLPFCTKNFLNFNDQTIKEGKIKVITEIKDDTIMINVIYPLKIEKEGSTTFIKDFTDLEIKIRLGIIRNAAEEITLLHEDKQGACINCLLDVTLNYDLYVDLVDIDSGKIAFLIKDKQSVIDDKPFIFIFAKNFNN